MSGNPFAATGKGPWYAAGRKAEKPARSRSAAPAAGKSKPAKVPVPFDGARAIAGLTDLPAGNRLVLPWPPKELNPNNRSLHPAKRSGFVKRYRHDCWALALEAFGVGGGAVLFPGAAPIAVRLDFFPPDGRSRDDDNCEAAFKAGRDGVAQALNVDDRRFVVTRRLRPEVRGCVVMTFLEGFSE